MKAVKINPLIITSAMFPSIIDHLPLRKTAANATVRRSKRTFRNSFLCNKGNQRELLSPDEPLIFQTGMRSH